MAQTLLDQIDNLILHQGTTNTWFGGTRKIQSSWVLTETFRHNSATTYDQILLIKSCCRVPSSVSWVGSPRLNPDIVRSDLRATDNVLHPWAVGSRCQVISLFVTGRTQLCKNISRYSEKSAILSHSHSTWVPWEINFRKDLNLFKWEFNPSSTKGV